MNQTIEQVQNCKRSLLWHFAIMFIGCVLVQIVIVIRGSKIDLLSTALLGVVAIYYFWYQFASHGQLSRLRFGRLVAHVVGFLIVNLSYHLHAFILFVTNSPAIKGSDELAIDPRWFGVLFGMMTFWGLGLLIHLIASIANRGFEELPRD